MIKFAKTTEHELSVPTRASEGAAGFDLQANIDKPLVIREGHRALIGTGWAIELPAGHVGMICPRSGLANRHGITVLNAPGIIDEDYRGEICVLLVNTGLAPVWINFGDRIAQMVIVPIIRPAISDARVVPELSSTERGAGGFGSTGV